MTEGHMIFIEESSSDCTSILKFSNYGYDCWSNSKSYATTNNIESVIYRYYKDITYNSLGYLRSTTYRKSTLYERGYNKSQYLITNDTALVNITTYVSTNYTKYSYVVTTQITYSSIQGAGHWVGTVSMTGSSNTTYSTMYG